MTRLLVHDTPALFEAIYLSTAKPAERFALLSPMLEERDGLLRQAQSVIDPDGALAVMLAGAVDGGCTLGQQGFGLFNPTRTASASAIVFDAFRRHDLLARAADLLRRCAAAQPANLDAVQVFLFPTDPANRGQMLDAYGMAGNALTPGVIMAQVYPTPEGLSRFDALVARWWAHQAWTAAYGQPQTLGDWLRMEANAVQFVERMVPTLSLPAWMMPFHPAPDWDATLLAMAVHYGLAQYDDMTVNTYGQASRVGAERIPLPTPLDADFAELVISTMNDALDERAAPLIAAHLYGDAIVARQGFPGVGMPPFAAYACLTAYITR